MSEILIVGEDNPYGADPRYALFPEPPHASGGRLCRLVMGLERREYMRAFDRANLCETGKWSVRVARDRAGELLRGSWLTYVLLGQKVRAAFGVDEDRPLTRTLALVPGTLGDRKVCLLLPHPSARCRHWNDPGAFVRARDFLRANGVLPESPPPGGAPAVRPW